MNNKYSNEKSRNDLIKDDIPQQTAEPISLYEIKNISKDIISIIKTEMDSIVQLLHSIHEEISKKFANSPNIQKIEEVYDKNLELILNYFIRCFQHTDTVKVSITNNILNGLSNIQNVASILTDQYLSQEKINENPINSNFVFDEDFVSLINSLSSSIKEFMKDCKSSLKVINTSSELLIKQLVISKSTISDLLLQFNSGLLIQNNQGKFSQKQTGNTQQYTKDKIIKEKLSALLEKVELFSAFRIDLSKNLKFVDNYYGKFYEDAKIVFKKLKMLHNEKLNDIQKLNTDFNQKPNDLISNQNDIERMKNTSENELTNYLENNQKCPNCDNYNNIDCVCNFVSFSKKMKKINNINYKRIESISPLNIKRPNSSNLIKRENSNILVRKEKIINSNPMVNISNNKNNILNLNKSMGNILNIPGTPINNKTSCNSFVNISTKNSSNLNKSLGLSGNNINKKKNINNLSTSYNTSQNCVSENEFLVLKKNDELIKHNNRLLTELNLLNDSYKKLNEENLNLKKINSNFTKEENLKNEDPKNKILNSYKKSRSSNKFSFGVHDEFKLTNNNETNNKNLNNPCYYISNNTQINSKNSKPKISGFNDNFNFEENDKDENNINISVESIKNSNNIQEYVILSEKIIYFIDLMNKLQEKISKKCSNVREIKLKFEDAKNELIRKANDCINTYTRDSKTNTGQKTKNDNKNNENLNLMGNNNLIMNFAEKNKQNFINSKSLLKNNTNFKKKNLSLDFTKVPYLNKNNSKNFIQTFSQAKNIYTPNNKRNSPILNYVIHKNNQYNYNTEENYNNNNKVSFENQTFNKFNFTNSQEEELETNINYNQFNNLNNFNDLINQEKKINEDIEENNNLLEINENLLRELQEIKESQKNLLDDIHSKGNLIVELNDKILNLNQTLLESLNKFNEEKSKNKNIIQLNEERINQLLNELNLTKLTNEALYAQINKNKTDEIYEIEEETHNNVKEEEQEENEKFVLNLEIQKLLNENYQYKEKFDNVERDLEATTEKLENLSLENLKINEIFSNLKNSNLENVEEIKKLNLELEKKNTLNPEKENNFLKLNKKIKEFEELTKENEKIKSREKLLLKENQKLSLSIEEFEKQINLNTNTINELQIKIKVNKNERDSLNNLIEKFNKEIKDYSDKISSLEENLKNTQNNENKNNNLIKNLRDELNLKQEQVKKIELEKNELYNNNLTLKEDNLNLQEENNQIKNKFNIEKQKKNENLNLVTKNLEDEILKLSKLITNKDSEIKTLCNKNDELKNEIKNTIKFSDNQKSEIINFKKNEEKLKSEIQILTESKNIINSLVDKKNKNEEILKDEISNLKNNEENLNTEINNLTKDLENKKNEIKNYKERVDKLKLEKENVVNIQDDLNKKVKDFCDNEGILKLAIEKHNINDNNFKSEIKTHIEKVNNLKIENKNLLKNQENLKAELQSIIKENESYKEIFQNSSKNEDQKILLLKNKISELENDKLNLNSKLENLFKEIEIINNQNSKLKHDFDILENKFKDTQNNHSEFTAEKNNLISELISNKKITEDEIQKSKEIYKNLIDENSTLKSELENKINIEIKKLNQIISEKEIKNNLDNNKFSSEKNSLEEKYENLKNENNLILKNKNKLKDLQEIQLNYLLKFSDQFLDLSNNIVNNIENLNSKLSQNDFAYQINILENINEINFSDLKDTFQKIRSNNIIDTYDVIIKFFDGFFEEKILKIPDNINSNVYNIFTKFTKLYEDFSEKIILQNKSIKENKFLTEKLKNSDIEKLNLSTLLDGKDQECESFSKKYTDLEKKFNNFKLNSKSQNEKNDFLEKENKKFLEGISKLQGELSFYMEENKKLKSQKNQLNNFETLGCNKNDIFLDNVSNSETKEKLIKSEEKYNELFEDNKKLKIIFDECIQTIYDAIKLYSPNLFEDDQIMSSSKNNNLKNNNIFDSKGSKNSAFSINSNYSLTSDKEMISSAVELFKKYNKEINEKNKKLQKENSELESNNRMYKIISEEYKNALDFAMKKNDKLQYDNIHNDFNNDNNIISNSHRSTKQENIANFTVEDIIEAGEINLENPKSSRRENTNKNNLKKNIENLNFKDSEIKLFLNFNKENDEEKFNFEKYLEKFNNPSEYKIAACKKINDELIWYLLVEKKIDNLLDKLDIFNKNIDDINDLNILDNCENSGNLVKTYDNYMWIPGKIISLNLPMFEFDDFSLVEKFENKKENESSLEKLCIECKKNKSIQINKNPKLEDLEKKNNNNFKEKNNEIKDLLIIQDDLCKKLSEKSIELENYKETCNKLLKINSNNLENIKSIPLEKYEVLLNEFKEEQEKGYELTKVYEQLKNNYDNLHKKIYNPNIKENTEFKGMNKSFNTKDLKDFNNIEMDDILHMYNKSSFESLNEVRDLSKKINNLNTLPIENNKILSKLNNQGNTESEIHDFSMIKTEGYYIHENIKDAVADLEKNERLLMDQLIEIKEELKQTRNEREIYKKKCCESITLHDGKKIEILNMLRSAVEKLILEIQLTPKIKELLTVILRICDIDDEQINTIFKEKDIKKKNFFGFMSKK